MRHHPSLTIARALRPALPPPGETVGDIEVLGDVVETDRRLPMRMFVYGTLRRDLSLFGGRYDDKGQVVGPGTITGQMHKVGGFPGVIPHPEDEVVGQVISFEVMSDGEWEKYLRRVDGYEGVPNLFRRERVEVQMPDNWTTMTWVYYFAQPERLTAYERVWSGDWADVVGERVC